MGLSEERLTEDLRRAMKARDMTVVYVLRAVTAAAKNLKIERRTSELSEADLLEIVRRELKKRQEAEDFARQAGRDELVQQNASERAVLEPYLPEQLTGAALETCVRGILAAQPAAALGQVMAALKAQHAGRYEGKEASEVARRVLAERAAG